MKHLKRVYSLALCMLMAVALLAGCGSAGGGAEADTEGKYSKVATTGEMSDIQKVVDDSMTPITADQVKDGVYPIVVDSSSTMFKIIDCKLTVKDGKMTADMLMSGQGYLFVYMGTGQEAAKASESDFIPFEENEDGVHTFTVPVEALDQGISCAAFSKNKEKWYDRTIVFRADSLPFDAFEDGVVTTVESLKLADGTYTADVTLGGGSGRASVTSPAVLTVKDGKCTALIEWSSPNYDYMLVDGEKYEMVNKEGNSQFEIPVKAFDYSMAVVGDTIAMSEPHEIDYTLKFDSASIKEK